MTDLLPLHSADSRDVQVVMTKWGVTNCEIHAAYFDILDSMFRHNMLKHVHHVIRLQDVDSRYGTTTDVHEESFTHIDGRLFRIVTQYVARRSRWFRLKRRIKDAAASGWRAATSTFDNRLHDGEPLR